jgi:DNA primase
LISPQTIQQIQSRIDIIDIVGGFVRLKKRGTNYIGLCPFHNEKSPSFTVSPSKEIYKCFGCGRSGNSISFLMEHEKYTYVEALRWLARKYNVEVEETNVSDEARLQQQVAESLHIINSFGQQFFSEQLFETEEGVNAGLGYLKERGFREDIIKKFQIGYSPEARTAFASAALARKYNPELLQKSGLIALRNDELVDNYRGRIIFPVHNNTGKVIGFGARLIKKNDKAPKYINTPENELYVKSKILYGSYFARQAIDKQDECLLVEGYTDVVSLHQAGIENVVASGGTSLTQDQLRLIRKFTNNLTIIYDGDSAGVKAALRGLDMALEEGLNVQLVLIPDKEDPDSYVNKVGPQAFRDFIRDNRKDFILFQLEISLSDIGNDSNKKAAVVTQMAETISRINKAEDFTKQQDYIRKCAEILRIEENGLNTLVNKFIRERVQKQENKMADTPPETSDVSVDALQQDDSINLLFRDEQQERAVVRSLIEFGLKSWDEGVTVADHIFSELIDDDLFDNQQLLGLIKIYRAWYEQGLQPTAKQFLYQEDQALSTLVVSIMDFPYEISSKWKEEYEMPVPSRDELYKEETASTLNYLKLRKIKRMIGQNQKDMERPHNDDEQMVLIQTHQHLKMMEIELTNKLGTVILK